VVVAQARQTLPDGDIMYPAVALQAVHTTAFEVAVAAVAVQARHPAEPPVTDCPVVAAVQSKQTPVAALRTNPILQLAAKQFELFKQYKQPAAQVDVHVDEVLTKR